MSYLGSWKIDDNLTFALNVLDPATNQAAAADSAPSYRIYEDETATPILTGNLAALDSGNTTGFYTEQITLSAANGFEKGKCYTIYMEADVSTNTITRLHNLQIEAEVDVKSISGDSAAADNLETMLDGTGGATLSLGKLNIIAGGNDTAIVATGGGTGKGCEITGGSSGATGMEINGGGAASIGLDIQGGSGNSTGMNIVGNGASGLGVGIVGQGTSLSCGTGKVSFQSLVINNPGGTAMTLSGQNALTLTGTDFGLTIQATNQNGIDINSVSGAGIYVTGSTNDIICDGAEDITANIYGNLSGSIGSLGTTAKQGVRDSMKLTPTAGAPATGAVDEHLDTIETNIGTPVAVDGGAATLAGMILKIMDDNGGADFDGSTDSLTEIINATIPELPATAPASQPTLKNALMLIYMAFRNNSTKTTTERQVKNDAGTTICKATETTTDTEYQQGKLGNP
jgi:hypothetical protein